MIIFLTGFMGVGKTTIGKSVAQDLCIPFIDLDEYIEELHKQTIPEIFKSEGELSFRNKELSALESIIKKNTGSKLVALGGGTLCNHESAKLILSNGICVYLKKDWPNTLLDLEKLSGRPILERLNTKELEALFNMRQEFYHLSQLETFINSGFSPKKLVNLLKLQTNK